MELRSSVHSTESTVRTIPVQLNWVLDSTCVQYVRLCTTVYYSIYSTVCVVLNPAAWPASTEEECLEQAVQNVQRFHVGSQDPLRWHDGVSAQSESKFARLVLSTVDLFRPVVSLIAGPLVSHYLIAAKSVGQNHSSLSH